MPLSLKKTLQQPRGLLSTVLHEFLMERVERDEMPLFKQMHWAAALEVDKKLVSLEGRKRKGGYLHPSESHCLRQMFLHLLWPEDKEKKNPEDDAKMYYRVWSVGDAFHHRLQSLCLAVAQWPGSRLKIDIDDVECGFRDEGRKIEGTADLVPTIDGARYVVDFKSIDPFRFSKLPDSALPKDEPQLRAYMRCLGVSKGILYYESKDMLRSTNDGVLEFVFEDDADSDFVDTMYAQLSGAVRERKIPKKNWSKPSEFPCRWCDYASVCHGMGVYDRRISDDAFQKAEQFFRPKRKFSFGRRANMVSPG